MAWDVIAGQSAIVALMGIIFGYLKSRIEDLVKNKVDAKVCNERHQAINANFERHDENIKELFDKIDSIMKILIRIETKIDNGGKNGKH